LSDKSTGVGDQRLIDAFNSFIETHHLREIHRVGPRFTWTNKQSNPVMSNIDRILASTEWDLKFPTSCLNTLTRVGSDHCPLLLDTGGLLRVESTERDSFFLEKQWFKMEGFLETVADKWRQNRDRCPARAYSMDKWHGGVATLRNFLKGWGRSIRGEYRRRKEELLQQILEMDVEDSEGMSLQGGNYAEDINWKRRWRS
jgi:hypothetical protein